MLHKPRLRHRLTLNDVVAPWAHVDDWGVEVIGVAALQRILAWLDAGVPPAVIMAHAKHVASDCTEACAALEDGSS